MKRLCSIALVWFLIGSHALGASITVRFNIGVYVRYREISNTEPVLGGSTVGPGGMAVGQVWTGNTRDIYNNPLAFSFDDASPAYGGQWWWLESRLTGPDGSGVYDLSSTNITPIARTYTVVSGVTNTGVEAGNFRFYVPASGTNAEIAITSTYLNPGASISLTNVFTRSFTNGAWQVGNNYPWTAVTNQGLTGFTVGDPTWSNVWCCVSTGATNSSNVSLSTNYSAASLANIWNSATNQLVLGVQAALSNPAPVTTNASAELNADARATAQRNLTVAANESQKARDMAAIGLAAGTKASIDAGNQLARQIGAANIAALNGLSNALSGGGDTAALNNINNSLTNGYGTSYTATGMISGFVASSSTGALSALATIPTIGSGVAPVVTVPLTALHADLGDIVFDFGSSNLSGWAATLRAFALVLMTIEFWFLSVAILSKATNV